MIQSVFILNKAGGLVYQKNFKPGATQLSANDYLMLAGTFHGVHALTSRVSPVSRSSGVSVIETSKFALHCFQTLSGIKFLLVCDKAQFAPEAVMNRVYQIFADYVMKNPFYQLDMPIRCDQFDRHLNSYLTGVA